MSMLTKLTDGPSSSDENEGSPDTVHTALSVTECSLSLMSSVYKYKRSNHHKMLQRASGHHASLSQKWTTRTKSLGLS